MHARVADVRLAAFGDAGILEDHLHALFARLPEDADARGHSWPAYQDGLTAREQQILVLLASAMSLRDVGHQLYVSRNTMKTHVSSIYRKLGVSSRTAAVARARELDTVD